ncbi:MAG: DinB family protein [Candidatus Heimdallarchaeaceae archaeon]
MISIKHLYDIVVEDRKKTLGFFKKIDKKHFYTTIFEKTWTPEQVFRHLLMNIQWMLEKIPNGSTISSKLAIDLEEEVTNQATLEEILNEFEKISPILNGMLSLLTKEQEEEDIDYWKGKMQRRVYLVRLINHEHRHLGQIQWILKRSTGWTDKEIYGATE